MLTTANKTSSVVTDIDWSKVASGEPVADLSDYDYPLLSIVKTSKTTRTTSTSIRRQRSTVSPSVWQVMRPYQKSLTN